MSKEINSLTDLLDDCPVNQIIADNLVRAWTIVNRHKKVICAISGGSDSDVILDIVNRVAKKPEVYYVFCDTGVEYRATKEHLDYLEKKYGIEIIRLKASEKGKSIVTCCKQYGQPFLSKQVSTYMERLQSHNFEWENESFEVLYKKYPNCKSALMWWCNEKGGVGKFNINRNKWLKEFILENPPTFRISAKCCDYAKKKLAHSITKELNCDLSVVGIRKAEGGARAGVYTSCFSEDDDGVDSYRPLFWYKSSDKAEYVKHFGLQHSKCYTEYGLKRTGCVGCPFSNNLEDELNAAKVYEPNLYKAMNNIFKDSYEYTKLYREFCKKMNRTCKNRESHQMTIDEWFAENKE